jgi:hypothetical protein
VSFPILDSSTRISSPSFSRRALVAEVELDLSAALDPVFVSREPGARFASVPSLASRASTCRRCSTSRFTRNGSASSRQTSSRPRRTKLFPVLANKLANRETNSSTALFDCAHTNTRRLGRVCVCAPVAFPPGIEPDTAFPKPDESWLSLFLRSSCRCRAATAAGPYLDEEDETPSVFDDFGLFESAFPFSRESQPPPRIASTVAAMTLVFPVPGGPCTNTTRVSDPPKPLEPTIVAASTAFFCASFNPRVDACSISTMIPFPLLFRFVV